MSAGRPRRSRSSAYTARCARANAPNPRWAMTGRRGAVVVRDSAVGACARQRARIATVAVRRPSSVPSEPSRSPSRVGRRAARAAGDDPRRCRARRRARGHGVAHDQRPGEGRPGDPAPRRSGGAGSRLRPEPCRPRPDHRAHGQRRGDRARHHQPALRVAGAIGRAVGPREPICRCSWSTPASTPTKRSGPSRVPVAGGRRVHRRLAAPPAPRAGRPRVLPGGLRQPSRPPSTRPSSSGPRRPSPTRLHHLARSDTRGWPTWAGRAGRGRRGSAGPRSGAPSRTSGMEVVELAVAEPTFEAAAAVVPAVVEQRRRRPCSPSTTRWRSGSSPG